LVFNDNGTLRMDCAQVNDGVTATPQASSAVAVQGVTQAVHQNLGGPVGIDGVNTDLAFRTAG
jgi:hypothetical protein